MPFLLSHISVRYWITRSKSSIFWYTSWNYWQSDNFGHWPDLFATRMRCKVILISDSEFKVTLPAFRYPNWKYWQFWTLSCTPSSVPIRVKVTPVLDSESRYHIKYILISHLNICTDNILNLCSDASSESHGQITYNYFDTQIKNMNNSGHTTQSFSRSLWDVKSYQYHIPYHKFKSIIFQYPTWTYRQVWTFAPGLRLFGSLYEA